MKYLELFLVFMKIGVFSFGGGYAMIPFCEEEIAFHSWASAADYKKLIAIAQMIPGPFAIDSSAYIGYKVSGITGAILASIAVSLPSFLALVLITRFYVQFKTNTYIQLALNGVRPAVIGLLIGAAYIIGISPLFKSLPDLLSPNILKAALVVIPGYCLLRYTRINPMMLIFLSGTMGVLLF